MGVNGPGIESRWKRNFPHASRPALGPSQPPAQGVQRHCLKRQRRGVKHPPPSCAEVKERVELYLYSPFMSSWQVTGWTLHFYLYLYTQGRRVYIAKIKLGDFDERQNKNSGFLGRTERCVDKDSRTPKEPTYLLKYSMEQSPSWEANWFCS